MSTKKRSGVREFEKGNGASKTVKKEGEGKMTPAMGDVITKARSEMKRLTGLEPASTVKALKNDKGWRILIEMIEKRSIPDSMDILATYEVLLDDSGNLVEFNRTGMRKRVDTAVNEG